MLLSDIIVVTLVAEYTDKNAVGWKADAEAMLIRAPAFFLIIFGKTIMVI